MLSSSSPTYTEQQPGINLDSIRQDTLGCHDKIYLNSAGASLMPQPVVQIMRDYLNQEEQLGGYAVEQLRTNDIQDLYTELAQLLRCQPRNIAYTNSSTESFAKALSAIPFKSNNCIVTTNDDYISNQIAFLALQKRLGLQIWRADNLENGDIDLNHFEQLVQQHQPALVAITHIPTNSGLVQQVEEVGKICRHYGIWYLLDACQSVGQMEVYPEEIGCDFLTASGRKFLRGPRNTGFLYVSDRVLQAGLEPLFIDRRGAEWTTFDGYQIQDNGKRFEYQEISGSLAGLTEAIRYANKIGIANIAAYNQTLRERLRENLSAQQGLELLDKGSRLSNLVTFRLPGVALETIVNTLKSNQVVYTVSYKNFALIDFTKKGVDWAIRFSPHYFNTLGEMDNVSDIVARINR
ncbi:aminotransferase [Adhaeribacter arboris]|uniref:Aminotransferase n=2 Tax=Adhaeribacter arboris TaxID=2072846 RepID=A0A2T2YPP7_9BACT|nr:aminotransferase [Adhaeribacter arboris]